VQETSKAKRGLELLIDRQSTVDQKGEMGNKGSKDYVIHY
jgi:hypothetical protein